MTHSDASPRHPIGDPIPSCIHCDLPVPHGRRHPGGPLFCCFGCRIAHELARPAAAGDGSSTGGTLLLRLGLGIFLAMNIMMFSGFFYSREWFGPVAEAPAAYGSLTALLSYLLMLLATAVLLLLGTPLAADALTNLLAPAGLAGSHRWFQGRIDANLLICIGVAAAYGISVTRTLSGEYGLYYDTAAMVLVLVTLGNYLEAGARRRAATEAGDLLAALPSTVQVRRDDVSLEIDAGALQVGDLLEVRAGEAVAVDGRLIEGSGTVDESSLTGESVPRSVVRGDELLAGSINLDGPLRVEALRVGKQATLGRVQRALDEARRQRPGIQRLADRIAAYFVPGVVLLALVVFGWNAWQGQATIGLFSALSVLLISCPCALGLAAPLAAWNALRRATRRGILIDSAVTLERAARIDRLFLDKTGTLTTSQPRVAEIEVAGDVDEVEVLSLAASLETACLHPVARALIEEARRRGAQVPEATEVRVLPGLGVEGRIGGRKLALGGDALVVAHRPSDPARASAMEATGRDEATTDDGDVRVHLFDEEQMLARFRLEETLRPDARSAVSALSSLGIEISVLTGDRRGPAESLGRRLDLPVESGLLPEDKLERLKAARESRSGHRTVAMVGDGINDGPVLAAADVGFAMGSAADLARQAGNVRLISDRLDGIPLTVAISRDCMRRIRLNLTWAFGYNGVGLTLAALGLLNPIFAASAMFVSSLVVVLISRGSGKVGMGLSATHSAVAGHRL